MNTTIVLNVIEQWCKKYHAPISLDDIAIVLAKRLNQSIDYGDLRDLLDILIAVNQINEPTTGMFQI